MGYKLTANCDDRWDPILEIPLYESVPEPETAPLEEIRESGVTLYEKREYSNWTLLSSDRKVDPNSCTFMANGVDLTDPKHKQPFLLQFGFVQFVVTITEKNGSSKTLRSKYCNAFQTEEKENLQNMVSQILNIDDGDICDLLRWPSVQQEGRQSSKLEKYSMISGALQQTGGVDSSRLPLERVLDIYKRHGGYFKVRPEYTIRRTPVTTPFHRVKTLTSDSMLWSARTGNLRKVNSGGIQVGGQHYLPMETLSETAERDYHIYENRIILGFLDTVIRKIREKENLQDEHTEFDILRMIFYPEEAGWDKSGLY